ncbi:MAG: hypothetical protein CVU96_01240 [Firmicutes bacterium HGW-Firmicutes-20]|jgi:uncharacterized membrane protein required for colicin V production|nr:MAG: hypothetical protein CVU96_01240 [Firmicutes bacterium HGW-Firmicutes-20]PKM69670.1 MAG: hypothetical protein CVU94_02825 [Firmicutes bacterium HGW-Firmicutes-19]
MIINVTFILLLIGFGVYGYFRGLFRQGIDIASMLFIAWLSTLVAPLLAKNIDLIPNLSISDVSVVSTIIRKIINSTLWIIALFVVFMILVGIVRILVLRNVQKPWNKNIDRYGGVALSITIPIIVGIILVSVLSLPVFANGKEIVSSTVLSPLAPIGDSVSETIVKTVDPDGLLDKISRGEELNEEDTDSLIDILIRMGIPEEIARILAKAYTGVEITADDTNKVKQWITSQGYSKEDIRNMLKEVGLTEDQINEIMDEYTN